MSRESSGHRPAPVGVRVATLRRAVSVMLMSLVLATALHGQDGISGSRSFTLVVQDSDTAGDRSASMTLTATTGVGQVTAGYAAASVSYRVRGGVVAAVGGLAGGGPLLFGVEPSFGDLGGGDVVTVIGHNLAPPGAPATVSFGASAGLTLSPASSSSLTVQVPPGANACGNPLAEVDVGVMTAQGTFTAPDAWVYTPALSSIVPPVIGQSAVFRFLRHQMPAGYILIVSDVPVPPFLGGPCLAPPLAGLAGAIEVNPINALVQPLRSAPGGFDLIVSPIPNLPSLQGVSLSLQALSLDTFLPTGQFTNRLVVTIQ